ncbi:hypothetical protein E4U10_007525 [Claviceps purpurea]|nr:hypothetical protein E4U10_007525 [Claviceps purpurea]
MNNAETASRPDFLPAGELKLVLHQRGHCEQVPPFQSGARVRLTGLLQSLLDLFNEIEEESREDSGDLGQRLDALDLKLTMPNRNFIARMNNRTVVDEVPSDIKAMLIELGEVAVLDREGDKRRQLETAFGAKTRAVQTRQRATVKRDLLVLSLMTFMQERGVKRGFTNSATHRQRALHQGMSEANRPSAIRNLLQAVGVHFEPSWANGKLIKLAEYKGILPPNFTLVGIANGRYEVAFV